MLQLNHRLWMLQKAANDSLEEDVFGGECGVCSSHVSPGQICYRAPFGSRHLVHVLFDVLRG